MRRHIHRRRTLKHHPWSRLSTRPLQHGLPERDDGQGIEIGNGTNGYFQMVGVAGDVHYNSLDTTPDPTMHAPLNGIVRRHVDGRCAAGDPEQFAGTARQAVRELDAGLPAFSMTP